MRAKGKRCKTNLRVSCSPDGQRVGDFITRFMARSTSATKATAAASLRSKYQDVADFSSSSAAGCISSSLATIEDSGDLPPRFSPGDGLHPTGVQFLDPTRDLFVPLFFCRWVNRLVEAFQQRAGQSCSCLARQG